MTVPTTRTAAHAKGSPQAHVIISVPDDIAKLLADPENTLTPMFDVSSLHSITCFSWPICRECLSARAEITDVVGRITYVQLLETDHPTLTIGCHNLIGRYVEVVGSDLVFEHSRPTSHAGFIACSTRRILFEHSRPFQTER